MQLIIERRLKAHIANGKRTNCIYLSNPVTEIERVLNHFISISEKPPAPSETTVSHEAVQESIMAVDETINNLIKELKQERKSHHKVCQY